MDHKHQLYHHYRQCSSLVGQVIEKEYVGGKYKLFKDKIRVFPFQDNGVEVNANFLAKSLQWIAKYLLAPSELFRSIGKCTKTFRHRHSGIHTRAGFQSLIHLRHKSAKLNSTRRRQIKYVARRVGEWRRNFQQPHVYPYVRLYWDTQELYWVLRLGSLSFHTQSNCGLTYSIRTSSRSGPQSAGGPVWCRRAAPKKLWQASRINGVKAENYVNFLLFAMSCD